MSQSRLIGIIGLVTWLMVGLPALLYHAAAGVAGDWRWSAVFLLFGVVFAADLRRPHLLLLALASAAALTLVLLRCNGYEGALLALVAMQLGTRVGRTTGIVWILGQTVLLGVADAIQFSPRNAWLLVPPYLGFQLVAFFVFNAMAREVAARAALAASNAELRAVGQILADSSRMAERLLEEGIYVIGFSYPVVPHGQARIRLQASAAHTAEQIDRTVAAFTAVGKELGMVP